MVLRPEAASEAPPGLGGSRLLAPTPRAAVPVGLAWSLELAFLTSSKGMSVLLVQGPHSENHTQTVRSSCLTDLRKFYPCPVPEHQRDPPVPCVPGRGRGGGGNRTQKLDGSLASPPRPPAPALAPSPFWAFPLGAATLCFHHVQVQGPIPQETNCSSA